MADNAASADIAEDFEIPAGAPGRSSTSWMRAARNGAGIVHQNVDVRKRLVDALARGGIGEVSGERSRLDAGCFARSRRLPSSARRPSAPPGRRARPRARTIAPPQARCPSRLPVISAVRPVSFKSIVSPSTLRHCMPGLPALCPARRDSLEIACHHAKRTPSMTASADAVTLPGGDTVLVEISDRIAWVTMNRPEKRNAINPAMSFEMLDVFEALEADERCGVLVLTGAGEAYSSGMDLREYFRATDKLSLRRAAEGHAQERDGAVEAAAILRQADHRHGQRLVLWRRVQFADRLRSRHRRRGRDLRAVGNQLGHYPGRHRHQGGSLGHGPARRDVLHHDRRDFRRPQGGRHGARQRSGAARGVARACGETRHDADREKSHGAAHRQACGAPRARHVVGGRRGLSVRQARPAALPRSGKGPREGHDAIPRREILPAGARRLSSGQVEPSSHM